MYRSRQRLLAEHGLTVGTLGATAAQTIMVVLLPVLLAHHTDSAIWIGIAIGGEGLFAILVPYWVGALSDALPASFARRFGRRAFFLGVTAPLMAATLAVAPFLDGYWALAGIAFLFFAAFHSYLTPLWALMVDAVPAERRGRVHGVRGAFHAGGLAYGMVASGLLYALWPPLPFLLAGLLVLVTTALTIAASPGVPEHRPTRREAQGSELAASFGGAPASSGGDDDAPRGWRALLARAPVRWFLLANALWTGAIDGIRPYVFLFAVAVLGMDTAGTALTLMLLVGGTGLGAVLIGRLSDRYGRVRLLTAGLIVTTIGLGMGVFVRDVVGAVVVLTIAGVGGASLIALPYPLFTALVGDRDIGRYTGLYVLSMGLARVAAPVAVGAAIDLGRGAFPATRGYPIMWVVAAAQAALSLIAFRRAAPAGSISVAGGPAPA